MKKSHQSAETMTVDEAAKQLGIGRNQAYEAAKNGQIPCMRIGRRFLILRQPLQRLLNGEKRAVGETA